MSKIENAGGELFINDAGAEIKEIKNRIALYGETENRIRVWCHMHPHSFAVQMRVWGRTGETMKAKKRFMIATVHLDVKEIEAILNYAHAQKERYK